MIHNINYRFDVCVCVWIFSSYLLDDIWDFFSPCVVVNQFGTTLYKAYLTTDGFVFILHYNEVF